MPRKIRVHIAVNAKLLKSLLAVGLLAVLSLPLFSKNITMTTLYPSPAGIYERITATGRSVLARDSGSVGIGTASPSSSAALDVNSTTRGFLPPRMTSAQRDSIASPAEGLTVYNVTTGQIEFHNGSAWKALGGGGFRAVLYGPYGNYYQRGAWPQTNGERKRLVWITAPYYYMAGIYNYRETLSVNGTPAMECFWSGPVPPALYVATGAGCTLYAVVPPGGTYEFSGGQYEQWTEIDF